MATIFSKIISGELPCYKVAENNDFLAFLDINPLVEGHALVIPKKEVDYFFDLDTKALSEINVFAKHVAQGIRTVVPCKRIGVSVIGLEVPHAHMHLIPMNAVSDMNFANPKLKMDPSKLEELAVKISNEINLV